MVDFISEVQEELRKDDYNLWLRKYGPYVLGLIFAIIIAVSYLEWKKASDDRKARATSSAYIGAADKAANGEIDAALADYMAIAELAPAGYAGLSLMRASELELEKGNMTEAVKLLDQAASQFELPRHQQLAQMKAVYILTGEGRYADVKARVTPLAETGQPYEYLAREVLGFADKETGEMAAARRQFAYLERVPGVPADIRERAAQNLTLMGDEGLAEPASDTENATGSSIDNISGDNISGESTQKERETAPNDEGEVAETEKASNETEKKSVENPNAP